ncbi:Cytidylyltransferase family [Propionibacterium australiense]|uniref:Uncharacterized protein n=3 Tax=Propionibacterium australiense TaxID=119981 RepID=A0A383S4G3_9ACTN|nr:Hypothetical protein PROPAUS_0801 [Propionibacterium australiense]VEH91054.1 Cytidylyltransferase family [Propionibacterium australiense]
MPVRDSTATILQGLFYIAGAYTLCVLLFLTIRKTLPLPSELSRKLLHFSAIIVLTTWLFAFSDWRTAELTMAIFTVATQPILTLLEKLPATSSLSKVSSERRTGELHKSLGAACLMFMLVTAACWGWLGSRNLALASIFAWGPGDAAAALAGKRFGRIKIGRTRNKSLEGTLAMLALSGISVFVILSWGGAFSPWQLLLVSGLTAMVTTVVELVTNNGLDTLFCPAAAMTVLCSAQLLFQRLAIN